MYVSECDDIIVLKSFSSATSQRDVNFKRSLRNAAIRLEKIRMVNQDRG